MFFVKILKFNAKFWPITAIWFKIQVVSSITQCHKETPYPGKQRNIPQDLKLRKIFLLLLRRKLHSLCCWNNRIMDSISYRQIFQR